MGFIPHLAFLSWEIWALLLPPHSGCEELGTWGEMGRCWWLLGRLSRGPRGRDDSCPEGAELVEPHPCGWESILPDLLLCRIPPSLDNSLLHAIETIIIDWSHQIRDVLSKDSAQPLLDGLHPLPRVEFEFWDARLMNLKCIHEQVTAPLHSGERASVAPQPEGPRAGQADS